MNITTLQKCVEELKKETPNISYVLGMLETVIEIDRVAVPSYPNQYPSQPFNLPPMPIPQYTGPTSGSGLVGTLSDEEKTALLYAGGPIGQINQV